FFFFLFLFFWLVCFLVLLFVVGVLVCGLVLVLCVGCVLVWFLFVVLGGFVGGWVGGLVYVGSGCYVVLWLVSVVLSLVAGALNWAVRGRRGARLEAEGGGACGGGG
ncbi:hypothetical protein RA263_27845, partial [Pseudomonas syringae pv. tagetis]